MPTVLRVVGGVWAAIGVANLFGMPWTTSSSGLMAIGMMINMLLFIVPGLILFGLGHIMAKRRETASSGAAKVPASAAAMPTPARTVEDRLTKLGEFRERNIITAEEYERRRTDILKEL